MIYLIRYWKPLLLLALVLGLFGAGYAMKARIDAREAELAQAKAQAAQNAAERDAALEALALQEAATKAAQAARERNDEVLPTIRRESAGRVDRAATADAATGLQDDRAALDAYGAAAGRLRGKGPG